MIKNKNHLKLVYGVGISEAGEFARTLYSGESKTRPTKEYSTWCGMLKRCYNKQNHKNQPSYMGCSVSENFKNFQYFAKWCNEQIGFNEDKFQIDKDLLLKGNKVYSEDNCVFVHNTLNSLILRKEASRGEFPIGVHFSKGHRKFAAQLNNNGTHIFLGYFNTPEDAFMAYKVAKERFIKEQANLWKDKIDPRAYEALMLYKININD